MLDFGWVAVGPVLSSLLAEFGAEVIKVESSRRLDYARMIPSPLREEEAALEAWESRREEIDRVGVFHQYNRGKRGVTVDLRHPGAPGLLKRLVARCDVVVENFSPRVLRERGLEYEALRAVRPDLVMISCSAAGAGGPWEDLKTFAPSLSSLAGLERLIGYQGERVLGALTFGYADPSNAQHGLFAVLAALWHRERTGEGQWIDMSQLEATVGLGGEALLDHFMNGRVWGTQGATHLSLAPHGVYPCAESASESALPWVAIACQSNAEWETLAALLGDGEAPGDRFRVDDERIARFTRRHPAEWVSEQCQALGIASCPVLGLAAHADHPHFRARGLLDRGLYTSPIKLSATPGRIDGPAPALGADNRRVFQDLLGLSDSEFSEFVASGVIR